MGQFLIEKNQCVGSHIDNVHRCLRRELAVQIDCPRADCIVSIAELLSRFRKMYVLNIFLQFL